MPDLAGSTVFQVGAHRVSLISAGDRICGSVAAGKPFEPESLLAWSDLCRVQGAHVVDVGAYTGLFTIAARLAGCRVTAFEPMPENYQRLRQNAGLNLVSVKVNTEAVSDHDGEDVLRYNPIPYTSGASLLRRTGRALTVQALRLDSLEFDRLDAVKIDVERAEPWVLRGARATLERHHPPMLVEVLGPEERRAVERELPAGYVASDPLDQRNLLYRWAG